MFLISKSLVKEVPYVGPVISGLRLVIDVKKIIKNVTPISTAKTIVKRFVNECTPTLIIYRK